MRSEMFPLPEDPRWRRLVEVSIFLGLLFAFRHLAPVFVCFIVLVRLLGAAGELVEQRFKLARKRGLAVALATIAGALGLGIFVLLHRMMPFLKKLRSEGSGHVEALTHHPLVQQLRHATGGDSAEEIAAGAKRHAMDAVRYATGAAHVAIYLIVGVLLSVMYLLEREQLDAWFEKLERQSIFGTLARWGGYVGDAIAILVKIQAVTAVVNAIITLPVLLALGLPRVSLLSLIILVSGLLPVVGNFISGLVLCGVAYETRGLWAVAVFVFVTFVLHKIESYYLTPRLASAHVNLPGLVLVASLLMFEQIFGFWGLFLSFPSLYVAQRIWHEWQAELAAPPPPPPVSDA